MKHRFGLGRLVAWLLMVTMLLPWAARAEEPAQDPAATFAQLEARLLGAAAVSLDFHITAEGALAADLQGKLTVGTATPRPFNMLLSVWGEFAGEPVSAVLSAADAGMALGAGDALMGEPQPEHLAEAVLIGLTRMGILHNLARLIADAAPDHADGGVRDWVTVGDFAADPEDPAALSFAITVAGTPAATARLELDANGLPRLRQQTVRFPGGEMRVMERYSAVSVATAESGSQSSPEALARQVIRAEQGFAASMASRDFAAFQSFLAEEAVFFSGAEVLQGKAAVANAWAAYFEGEQPPFSWCPAQVVVLDSGTLAHSSGPVVDPEGECIATFNTVWRRRADQAWEVVFDKGEQGCAAGLQCL